MENNVHHDVYNADVCTRATKRGGGGEGRGTQRAKKEKKIGMGQRGGGEQSGDEKEEENRRGEHG